MYNSDIPTRAELPTSAQLLRSTAIAIVAAAGILVTIVLPAEYAIDPTGIGRMLKLTEMGEIKTQLAEEAAADRAADQAAGVEAAAAAMPMAGAAPEVPPAAEADTAVEVTKAAEPAEVAKAAEPAPVVAAAPAPAAAAGRSDEIRVTLAPGEGAEVKLVMKAGAKSNFSWTVVGGEVNVDLHGDGGGNSISYAERD